MKELNMERAQKSLSARNLILKSQKEKVIKCAI